LEDLVVLADIQVGILGAIMEDKEGEELTASVLEEVKI
jgi:hypothetical protein